MAYCPKCRREYAEGVPRCLECGIPLRPGRRPVRVPPDSSDLIVPVGSFVCLVIASLLLGSYVLARMGRLPEPWGNVVLMTQPSCLAVFYAIAAVASAATFGYWLFRRISHLDD